MDEFDVSASGDFTQSAQRRNLWQCCLPFLWRKMTKLSGNRAKRFLWQLAILNRFWQRCRKRSGAFPYVSMKWSEGNDFISSNFAVLPNHVPDPFVFCAVFQLLGGSHIRCVVMASFTEAVSNWAVIQFSNPEVSPVTFRKNKRRITIYRPITGNALCGRLNRNPSNIMKFSLF